MREVPYIKSPNKNACALACHLMVAKTFFPETTFEDLKSLLRWRDGYVVWAFPFWLWLLAKNLTVADWDSFPYKVWSENGFQALEGRIGSKTYAYIKRWTYRPDELVPDIKKLFSSKSFVYHQQIPKIDDVRDALAKNAVCEVTLNSCALNNEEGFAIHRVVVLEVSNTHVTFHDPVIPEATERPYRKETLDCFLKAWPEEVRELCVYHDQKK